MVAQRCCDTVGTANLAEIGIRFALLLAIIGDIAVKREYLNIIKREMLFKLMARDIQETFEVSDMFFPPQPFTWDENMAALVEQKMKELNFGNK